MISPPRWADRFLAWYCSPDILEEVQGDAHELFHNRVNKEGLTKANLKFVWDVIRFFRWSNIKRTKRIYSSNSFTMFKSYLRIGFRNMLRHGSTSFINTFGLALGVAGAITIFILADHFFSSDNFHTKSDRIYQVTNVVNRANDQVIWSDVPLLLGPALFDEVPGVEKVVRMEIGSGAIRYNEKVFPENIYFVDDSFFDVFDFPFIEGSNRVLSSIKNIVFTKKMAEKYFGDQSALGQIVSIKFSNDHTEGFVVGAVIDQPANNTMFFSFLLPMEVFLNLRLKDNYDWSYLTDGTFLLMEEGAHPSPEMMGKFVKLQNEATENWRTEAFIFFPFASLTNEAYKIESGVVGPGHPQGIWAMVSIAMMLLLLSCFNYMNISVATISTRLKEIGIRKVVGGRRKEIIQQFLTENFLLCTFSVGLGMLISFFFLMPGLNSLLPFKIPFAFSSGQIALLFFFGLLLFVVIVSGIYPSLYISSFKPTIILKGKEKFGQRSAFSRMLLSVQFVLAFITIVGSFVYIDNGIYLINKDWGYSHDQNILVPTNSHEQFLALRDQVSKNSHVLSYAGSANHIGYSNSKSSVEKLDEQFEIVDYRVGFNYMETMNLRLIEGRLFDETLQSDKIESVIINEQFAKTMGWETAIDQTFLYDSVKRNVIGLVEDFHYDDFYENILPVMFQIVPEERLKYLSLKVEKGHVNETEAWIQNAWRDIAPDDPYEGKLQDEVFANFKQNIATDSKVLGSVAALAVTLACLGLYGLVSYNITRRMKEFSVRKVFGANLSQIFELMNRDYIWILSISFLIGAPIGFLMMGKLIQLIYAEPQTAGVLPFATAIGVMIITVAFTIGLQMNRVVKENPAKTLRNE